MERGGSERASEREGVCTKRKPRIDPRAGRGPLAMAINIGAHRSELARVGGGGSRGAGHSPALFVAGTALIPASGPE